MIFMKERKNARSSFYCRVVRNRAWPRILFDRAAHSRMIPVVHSATCGIYVPVSGTSVKLSNKYSTYDICAPRFTASTFPLLGLIRRRNFLRIVWYYPHPRPINISEAWIFREAFSVHVGTACTYLVRTDTYQTVVKAWLMWHSTWQTRVPSTRL